MLQTSIPPTVRYIKSRKIWSFFARVLRTLKMMFTWKRNIKLIEVCYIFCHDFNRDSSHSVVELGGLKVARHIRILLIYRREERK